MKASKMSFQITKKTVKNIKTFLYRGKSFEFDFNLFKENSIYCYENRQFYKCNETINLLDGNEEKVIDLSDEVITTFINCCEGNACQIDTSNVIPLQFLSYKYDVLQLIEATDKFISDDFDNIALQSIIFKSQISNTENEKWMIKYTDCTKEESIITTRLADYFNTKDIFNLNISILERIIRNF